jgi:hypothetical protein
MSLIHESPCSWHWVFWASHCTLWITDIWHQRPKCTKYIELWQNCPSLHNWSVQPTWSPFLIWLSKWQISCQVFPSLLCVICPTALTWTFSWYMVFFMNPHRKKSRDMDVCLHVIHFQEVFDLKKHILYCCRVGRCHLNFTQGIPLCLRT